MKKIIIGVFSLVLILSAQNVFANGNMNTHFFREPTNFRFPPIIKKVFVPVVQKIVVFVSPKTCTDSSAVNYRETGSCVYIDYNNYNNNYNYNNYNNNNNNNNNNNYNNCSVSSFTVNGSSSSSTTINKGDSVILAWNTTGCSSVTVSGPSFTDNSSSNSRNIYPVYNERYTISASGNSYGAITKYIDINVNNYNNNYNYSTPSVTTNNPASVTNTGATLLGYVSGNGSLVNSWIEFPCYGTKYGTTYNQSYVNISVPVYSLNPNTNYNYCAVAQNVNNNQVVRGNTISFATNGQNVINQQPLFMLNKNVVTTIATNISQNQAQINGYIANTTYYNSNLYFDYGTTVNLGSRTNTKNANGNTNFSDVITGLNPNTIYYFQAVGEMNGVVSKGSVEIFKTLGNPTVGNTVTPAVTQGTTVVATASPVELMISNKYQLISEGDLVDYIVTYKNIGKSKLVKPLVQVVIPTNMTLVNSSRGTYEVDTHTLSAPVEDLNAGQEGMMYFQASVDTIPANNAQIVTTAILVYTSTTGAQENVMSYVINVPKAVSDSNTVGGVLGGSAFFAGLLSLGAIGWLIILLVILVIILISRSYGKTTRVGSSVTH